MTKMMHRLLLSTTILPLVLAGRFVPYKWGTSRACTLDCPTDAPCTFGETPFASPNEPAENGMHCACPPGWTGVYCDHKYESCSDSHDCYHGGECLGNELVDSFGNPQLVCDCSNAKTADGVSYVGKYCEIPFEMSCSPDNDELFCVNGADCNPNYANDGIACLCEDGWEGFHCEFKEGEVPDCGLNCANGGVCVVGVRSSQETDLLRRIWSDEEIVSHMRCLCPAGYGGPLCQYNSEQCGDDSCYHGGTCMTTTTTISGKSTTEYHCDCTTAVDSKGNRFTGDYCQEMSTVFCDRNDASLFCTNGGVCGEQSTDPCICPNGFGGHKCEYDTRFSPVVEPDSGAGNVNSSPSEPCGDIFCLNGAECTSQQVTLEDGTRVQEDVCDCTTAHEPNHYLFYSGDACQFKSTSVCSSSSGAEIKFCVNSGECQADSGTCSCPQGWTGEHCEIHTKDHQTDQDPTCGDTVCYNGGTCVTTSLEVDNEDGSSSTSTLQYCDCAKAFDDEYLYAGKSCEFKSTTVCTLPDGVGATLQGMLFCANHGTCRKRVQEGCNCPDGFSGMHCEFLELDKDPNESTDATEAIESCGDELICKNGGTCFTYIVTQDDGSIEHVPRCDCSTTATADTIFAGTECEHEATVFCTDPAEGLETAIFCVQGGKCESNVFEGCDCPDGWTGLHCEFALDLDDLLDQKDATEAVECGDAFCYNGGLCEVSQDVNDATGKLEDVYSCDCSSTATGTEIYGGATCSYRSTSVCQKSGVGGDDTLAGAIVCLNHGTCRNDLLEGCDCPSGFTGTSCEIEVDDDQHADDGEACGDGYCYHGGQCVTTTIVGANDDTSTLYHCDCSSAFDDEYLYAGDSCQHKSTTQCTHPDDGEDSLLGILFCVNGGTCKDDVEQGCDCPDGWTGFFCEFEEDPEDVSYGLDDYEQCGDYVCLNGGRCVSTTVTRQDDTTISIQYCDCNKAFDEETIYAGPNCEYQATVLCTKPQANAPDLGGVQFCVNGGKCNENNVLGECECPAHWTGLRCELEADYYDDDDGSVPCGDIVCLHGGKCLESATNDVGANESIEYSCDCSAAFDGFHLYDGPFCQYQSTELCDNPKGGSLSKVGFCVNNGKCQNDGACQCPSGYYGSRCELSLYENQDSEDVTSTQDDDEYEYSCVLACSNGGHCAKGAKDNGSLGDVIDNVAHLNSTYHETYFEHCVCPNGFVGLTCEHKVEVCGENDHYCLHGSTCVNDNGKHTCDCSQADEQIGHGDQPSVFAGSSCQHPANDICIQGAALPTRPLFFCVHGGTCKAYVSEGEDDPGCNCPEGWTGPHCETRIQEDWVGPSVKGEGAGVLIISVVTALLVFLLLTLVAFWIRASHESAKDGSSQDCMIFRRRRKHHELSKDPVSPNLAPRRFTLGNLASPSIVTSSSDPIAPDISLAPDEEPASYRDEPNIVEDDDFEDEIVLEVGPPHDEDGHQLHQVDMI